MRRYSFTLVEIMIVVAILGLLLAVLMPGIMQSVRDARSKSCMDNLRVIFYAQELVKLQESTDSLTDPLVNQHLRHSDPTCPASGVPYDLTQSPPVCPSVDQYPTHLLQ